ncbi:hypothetical protein [Pseudarthrobacter sp. PS3-L1]|uniref:hypothetical protein n=1 Tax=Pseudarthrobacter sp. PS3-L1 TaxID=3046207 RepID=UPI0024B91B96|nr:hypothetical protein [Pseudarthrobacter sp. PS3-L1]MDJ0321828.1 hypothetical protein [Pseudarthrobacter sp. PS3-L1]
MREIEVNQEVNPQAGPWLEANQINPRSCLAYPKPVVGRGLIAYVELVLFEDGRPRLINPEIEHLGSHKRLVVVPLMAAPEDYKL